VSLLGLAFRTLARMRGADRELALPTSVFWAANIVAAVLFGLGHLPASKGKAILIDGRWTIRFRQQQRQRRVGQHALFHRRPERRDGPFVRQPESQL